MALPDFTMRGLLEAGAHFGHQSHRWNPKMAPYIFGARNNIHIIDLAQTVPLLHQALKTVSDTVAKGGRVLFVGTKRQAQEQIGVLGTRVVVEPSGSLFRARVSGLSSRNGAEQACSRLRDRGACFIVAPGA